jgi:hypothetical protein
MTPLDGEFPDPMQAVEKPVQLGSKIAKDAGVLIVHRGPWRFW